MSADSTNPVTVPTPLQPEIPRAEKPDRPAPDGRGGGAHSYGHPYRRPSMFANWFWFILKNLVGWLLILTAMAIGPVVPGPGGLPLFLIGFGLITFPGKRRITARVLSGAPIPPDSRAYRRGVALVSVLLPAIVLIYLAYERLLPYRDSPRAPWIYGALYVIVALSMWVFGWRSVGAMNWLLRLVPRIRRQIRPWLRRRGIDLLPPRRRRRRATSSGEMTRDPDDEILAIHERHHHRVQWVWATAKPWVKRITGLAITAAIFWWMLKPVAKNWEDVRDRVMAVSWGKFALAAVMFALFLFTFRATTWRWILLGLGERLPVGAAARIWSISELARYLPGAIWQVLGRIYLVKPYGVSGTVTSASQLIELSVFLLANVLLALGCLVWYGIKSFEGPAERWLYGAMVLVPVLLFLLHPRVLYALLDRLMRVLRKPPVPRRLGFPELSGLLLWSFIGLLWQSLAIWLLVEEPLNLKLAKWWVVAGAYSLAWCAGFLAVWAPGGIGVRELVFMAAMNVALPPAVRERFRDDPAALTGFLAFLSVLLRLWATSGEVLLTGVTYLFDHRGAPAGPPRPRPDAGAKPFIQAAARELE